MSTIKPKKTRNWHAVNAKFRSSAGAMKSKKDDLRDEWQAEAEYELLVSERAEIESLLADIPEEREIERVGLEYRCDQIDALIQDMYDDLVDWFTKNFKKISTVPSDDLVDWFTNEFRTEPTQELLDIFEEHKKWVISNK